MTSSARSSSIDDAARAHAARLRRRAALAVRAGAVEAARDDPGGRGLADAADAGQQEGVGDPAGGERVLQRADQRLLADQRREPGGAIGAGEDPIGGGALQLRLHRAGGGTRRQEAEGWTSDPARNSLRLLPSGPDRFGEGTVHRQPSAAEYRSSALASARVQPGPACAIAAARPPRATAPSHADLSHPPQVYAAHGSGSGRASPAR